MKINPEKLYRSHVEVIKTNELHCIQDKEGQYGNIEGRISGKNR